MKFVSTAVTALLFLAGGAPSQGLDAPEQYHSPYYLGGGGTPSSDRGVYLYDSAKMSAHRLLQPGWFSYGHQMDVDNRRIVFSVVTPTTGPGPKSGIFRYDDATQQIMTVCSDPWTFYYPYKVIINQDGDYVVGCKTATQVGPSIQYEFKLLKISPGCRVTTIISETTLGRRAIFNGHVGVNIFTGNYLVCDSVVQTSPQLNHPVLDVADDGTVTVWSTGGNDGWQGFYSAPQNHRTGYIEGPYGNQVYQIKPGNAGRQVLANLNLPYPLYGGADFDLQTAARVRWVALGHRSIPSQPGETLIHEIDRQTFAVTATRVRKTAMQNHDFDFFRGRHTQTVKIASRKWQIRFSAHKYGKFRYIAAASVSGVRPGVALPDGRTINIVPDGITIMTLGNMIPSIWYGGPGTLDQNGEAQGLLDLSSIPRIGVPLWIIWMVLHPSAPGNIAYLPDTYVMQI